MGELIVRKTRILDLQDKLAKTRQMSQEAIRRCLSKDPMQKEVGARQCATLRDYLSNISDRLKVVSGYAYKTVQGEVDALKQRLNVCSGMSQTEVQKQASQAKTYER